MLDICLQILSIIGILLLALLGIVLLATGLVLFYPVTYRVRGKKDEEVFLVDVRAKWLLGLFRANYRYPEPGRIIAKALWFTIYDSAAKGKKADQGDGKKADQGDGKKVDQGDGKKADQGDGKKADQGDGKKADQGDGKKAGRAAGQEGGEAATGDRKDAGQVSGGDGAGEKAAMPEERREQETDAVREESAGGGAAREDADSPGQDSFFTKFSQKISKLKYTIRDIYGKIKEIWGNISYYIELLRDEDTQKTLSRTASRVIVVLRHIRPRRIRADILFGTGAPDTTGYAYGCCCMLASVLGKGFRVTPDFEQTVFRASFDAAGYVTGWVVLVNVLKLIRDERLKVFIRRAKAGRKKSASA